MPDRLTAEREAEIRRYVAEAAPGSWPFVFLSDVLAELDAVRAELARTETERDEWKLESDRGKWPKDAAQEFFRTRAERDALRTALEKCQRWAQQGIDDYLTLEPAIADIEAEAREVLSSLDGEETTP